MDETKELPLCLFTLGAVRNCHFLIGNFVPPLLSLQEGDTKEPFPCALGFPKIFIAKNYTLFFNLISLNTLFIL